jgi:hypothetical protein
MMVTDWRVSYQIWILDLGYLNRVVGVYLTSLRVMELVTMRQEILRLRSG